MMLPGPTATIALNPENFRALIRRQAKYLFEWHQAMPCDCNSSQSSEEVRKCPHNCEQGFIYTKQNVDPAVRVVFGETSRMMMDTELGVIPKGTSTITLMPDEVPISFADKIIKKGHVAWCKERYTRGSSATDALKRKPAIGIAKVAKGPTVYTAEADYILVGDTISWVSGHGPAAGETYSIVHTYEPSYLFLGELKQEAAPSQFDGKLLPLWGVLVPKLPFNGQ